ncbi:UNKNOWN [Stylonychia lemnae]|uniref:Uncharacterized protein n=1 Tax=Stylonychia lemnae TaxID=5949 RepID=A0A078B575_STYLE|nr:UNKNOWN [Stylonychia lemnae]|eukprot:CDW89579.1 UNKNOWN [Stylonychia lemnae]
MIKTLKPAADKEAKVFENLQKLESIQNQQQKSELHQQEERQSQIKMKRELDTLEMINNHKSLLNCYDSDMHPVSKIQTLAKLSHLMPKDLKQKQNILNSPKFLTLYKDIMTIYEKASDSNKLTIMYAYLKLGINQKEIFDMTAHAILTDKMRGANIITNALYVMAKGKYLLEDNKLAKDKKDVLMSKCASLLKNQVALPIKIACRNLWNFAALKYYDKELFDQFSQIIIKNQSNLTETDVANSMNSFAEVKHEHYPALESLIRITIRDCETYNHQSLAVILNALAKLEIKNMTIFNIVRALLLRQAHPESTNQTFHTITTVDCAQFMTAFAKVEIFDFELFESLESVFLSQIDQARGETLVTMYLSHGALSQDMIKQCFIEKRQKRRFWNLYKKYNEEFQGQLIKALINRIEDINIKGVFLIMAHGNVAHLKKRDNIRLMNKFNLKATQILGEEVARLEGHPDKQRMLVMSFHEYAIKYCLNVQERTDLKQMINQQTKLNIDEFIDFYQDTSLKPSSSDQVKADAAVSEILKIKTAEKEQFAEINRLRKEAEMLDELEEFEDEEEDEDNEAASKKEDEDEKLDMELLKKLAKEQLNQSGLDDSQADKKQQESLQNDSKKSLKFDEHEN